MVLAALKTKRRYRDLGRGATEIEILAVEHALRVALPDAYQFLLRQIGHAAWFGNTIFGVSPEQRESVIHWTTKARTESLPKEFAARPTDAVVVCQYGGGGYYFLFDTTSKRRGQVALLADEAYGNAVQSYPTLWDFMAVLI